MIHHLNALRGGKILLVSLIINVLGLLMAGGLGWHYRGKIADKLGLVSQRPSDASLLAFNNEKFEVLNDSLIVAGCDSSVSILFLGNSLTRHGIGIVEDFAEGDP